MVATRHHTQDYSEPETTPTKALASLKPQYKSRHKGKWAHTPSNLTILWLFISLPLVVWDSGYVLLRPLSMPGGKYHAPWKPYALYATVDYLYGRQAMDENDGFTGAQTFLNVIETAMYVYYLYLLFTRGGQSKAQGRGAPDKRVLGFLGEQRFIEGKSAALATLVAFSAAVMTVSKTVLYWAVIYYSGYRHIGHNDFGRLFVLWIIPNGAWIVLPSYMIYVFGAEILQGLAIAAGETQYASSDVANVKLL